MLSLNVTINKRKYFIQLYLYTCLWTTEKHRQSIILWDNKSIWLNAEEFQQQFHGKPSPKTAFLSK
uniref:Uncharacterized protein n=1 Tax=Anguilla anguilla TaxID=7936 RepID=A0A0E9X376_ANGAN